MLDCVTQCSQSAAHLHEQFLRGLTDWVCHIRTVTLCIEAVAWSCIIVTWWSGSGVIQAWSQRSTGFLQCFDTVGLVIWPVKIVPKMTYSVSSGTLNHTHSLSSSLCTSGQSNLREYWQCCHTRQRSSLNLLWVDQITKPTQLHFTPVNLHFITSVTEQARMTKTHRFHTCSCY